MLNIVAKNKKQMKKTSQIALLIEKCLRQTAWAFDLELIKIIAMQNRIYNTHKAGLQNPKLDSQCNTTTCCEASNLLKQYQP